MAWIDILKDSLKEAVDRTYPGDDVGLRDDVAVFNFRRGLRMLDAGFIVRIGNGDMIHHFESPRRDFRRMDCYGRRNDILFAWYNVPWVDFPVHLLGTSVVGMRLGFQRGRPWRMAVGLCMGYSSIFHELWKRKAVSRQTYRLHQRLKRGPLELEAIQDLLRPVRSSDHGLDASSGVENAAFPHRR